MKIFNVYFKSPSNTEFVQSFETSEEAIEKAKLPGKYYSDMLSSDDDACMEVSNSQSGELIFCTETENEKLSRL